MLKIKNTTDSDMIAYLTGKIEVFEAIAKCTKVVLVITGVVTAAKIVNDKTDKKLTKLLKSSVDHIGKKLTNGDNKDEDGLTKVEYVTEEDEVLNYEESLMDTDVDDCDVLKDSTDNDDKKESKVGYDPSVYQSFIEGLENGEGSNERWPG